MLYGAATSSSRALKRHGWLGGWIRVVRYVTLLCQRVLAYVSLFTLFFLFRFLWGVQRGVNCRHAQHHMPSPPRRSATMYRSCALLALVVGRSAHTLHCTQASHALTRSPAHSILHRLLGSVCMHCMILGDESSIPPHHHASTLPPPLRDAYARGVRGSLCNNQTKILCWWLNSIPTHVR